MKKNTLLSTLGIIVLLIVSIGLNISTADNEIVEKASIQNNYTDLILFLFFIVLFVYILIKFKK